MVYQEIWTIRNNRMRFLFDRYVQLAICLCMKGESETSAEQQQVGQTVVCIIDKVKHKMQKFRRFRLKPT